MDEGLTHLMKDSPCFVLRQTLVLERAEMLEEIAALHQLEDQDHVVLALALPLRMLCRVLALVLPSCRGLRRSDAPLSRLSHLAPYLNEGHAGLLV